MSIALTSNKPIRYILAISRGKDFSALTVSMKDVLCFSE